MQREVIGVLIFIIIHRNGREKYNNTKTTKNERKIEANNLMNGIPGYL